MNTRYLMDPFSELAEELDRFFGSGAATEGRGSIRTFRPAVNVSETEDTVEVKALLPGIDKDSLDILFEDGKLQIKAEAAEVAKARKGAEADNEKKAKKADTAEEAEADVEESKKPRLHMREIPEGRWERILSIGHDVASDDVRAHYENGVLSLSFPKREEAKPRQITVE